MATGQMTAEQATCFAEDDPHNGSSTTPSNPPASACSYSVGQYLFTTSWGEVMYAHYYNGSLYAGYQDGGSFRPQHWLIATGQMTPSVASCFAENDPHTTSNPPNIIQPSTPTAPSGTCGYSEGQYLLSNGTEAMYAHYYNGVLYAGYQDGSNFRPRHWLIATGKITVDQANCFAEDDPHTSTPSNPPTTTQSSNNNCGTGSGLTGFYSNTTDLSGNLAAVRTDAQVNFSWSDSPIAGVVNADGFSVRWFGQVEAPVSGNYTFKTNNDDGTRLWVNGQQLIEDWNGHGPTWQQGSIYLTAGQKYEIILDYFDLWGGAQAQLYWEYPGQSLQLIPSCRLYAKGNPTSNPTASIGRSCVISTGCIDYYVDCNTGEVVDAVFYDCQTTVIGNAPHHGVGVGAVPTGGQGQPIGHGSGGVSTGNPGTNTPTITEKPVPTTAYLDGIDCDKISGWAFANSGGYANLDIYITDPNGGSSGRLIKAATIKANNNARPDVRNAYGNNPNIPLDCGFVWGIPDAYKTGQPLTVRVVPANDITPNGDVSNSPLTSSARCSNPATTNPGGTGNPLTPGFGISPLFTDKPIDDYTTLEIISVTNRIYSDLGITSVDQLEQPPFLPPILFPYWLDQFHQVSREYTVLKLGNPGWSDFKCLVQAYKNVSSGKIHFLLDVFGTIPGAGEVADGINGGIYLLEGDNVNASLSFAATVPIAGWAATASKWTRNVLKYDGVGGWVSRSGLVFKMANKGNRLSHIFYHMTDDLSKPDHGVFYGTSKEVLSLVDEAWELIKVRGITGVPHSSGNTDYIVDMGRIIGRDGGYQGTNTPTSKILIRIVEDTPSEVNTAFPIIK